MISISQRVRDYLNTKPFIMDHLIEGLINANALSRHIKSEIESRTGEKVSVEAIAIAISRVMKEADKSDAPDPSSFVGDVSIQTGLTVLTYKSSDYVDTVQLITKGLAQMETFYIAAQGVWHSGIITKTANIDQLSVDCSGSTQREDNLVGLTVKLRTGHEPVLGVCAYIVSLLAQNGVNLEEIISTQDEMTMIIKEEFADIATDLLIKASKN